MIGKLKKVIDNIKRKIKYNGLSINKEKATQLRKKHEQANLKKIKKEINSIIKETACTCQDSSIRFGCDKAYGSLRYFLIKYDRFQIVLTEDQFYFLANYYIEQGFIITYTKRSGRVDNDCCKKEIRVKDKVFFDVKTLESINPEDYNFYIEW